MIQTDNLCKYLAEKYPLDFAEWVLGQRPTQAEILKTELSIEPIRADFVVFLKVDGCILHLEFQTVGESDPPVPLRMLDYFVRLYRKYGLPVVQAVVILMETAAGRSLPNEFRVGETVHRYHVIRMWEQSPELFLNHPALVPLAVFSRTTNPNELLTQVGESIETIAKPVERRDILTCTQILAGLRFDQNLIRAILRERHMRESVIYQEILEEGRQEGRQEGQQEGLRQGEAKIVLRLLSRRLGLFSADLKQRIESLPVARLEELGDALLDFQEVKDLETWLAQIPQPTSAPEPLTN